jgi:hypothetical protein
MPMRHLLTVQVGEFRAIIIMESPGFLVVTRVISLRVAGTSLSFPRGVSGPGPAPCVTVSAMPFDRGGKNR